MPWRNAVAQFIGATCSIASGHSVGREGPSVHLGAVNGSLLGEWLGLPNNSIRTLVACGVAAAIAASFNTPLAGVIFAMEVVMMEYTLSGFTPVILAAVSSTAVTRLVYGAAPAFTVPALQMGSVFELPYVLMVGIAMGVVAAAFIYLLQRFSGLLTNMAFWQRTTLAGLLTGLCALIAPGIMGIGYDTVNAALLGELGLWIMVGIVVFKLIATSACIGWGLPGGLIGPTLVIGATAGGIMGILANTLFPGEVASHGFYAMIGMGAMMAATLQAPLTALLTMLELTANPNILLPGMLAVVAADLICSELFKKDSIFIMMVRARGLDYRNDPVAQSLRRIGVTRVMNRNFVCAQRHITLAEAKALLEDTPQWIIVTQEDGRALLPAADLVRHLYEDNLQENETMPETDNPETNNPDKTDDLIDLLEFPAKRKQLASVHLRATLQEALDGLNSSQAEVLCVINEDKTGTQNIYGIITRQDIEENYRYTG